MKWDYYNHSLDSASALQVSPTPRHNQASKVLASGYISWLWTQLGVSGQSRHITSKYFSTNSPITAVGLLILAASLDYCLFRISPRLVNTNKAYCLVESLQTSQRQLSLWSSLCLVPHSSWYFYFFVQARFRCWFFVQQRIASCTWKTGQCQVCPSSCDRNPFGTIRRG